METEQKQKWHKSYDLAVKVSQYVKDGETKNRYENVGAIFEGEKGQKFITMKRTFNPAGVPVDSSDRESIFISMFDQKKSNQSSADNEMRQSLATPFEDDIPF